MKRKYTVTALVGIGIVSTAIGWTGYHATTDPLGPFLRANISYQPVPESDSRFSADHRDRYARIVNGLGRKTRWSAADKDLAMEIIRPWTDEPVPDWDDMAGMEAYFEWEDTMGIMAERIGWGVPTDSEATAAFRDTVAAMFQHPQAHARSFAIGLASTANMIPDHRRAIEAMMGDPDARVSLTATNNLAMYDGRPMPVGCPTCPGGKDYAGDGVTP